MLSSLFKKLIIISFIFCSIETVFANNSPFTDISPSDTFYQSVLDLHKAKIISDDGSHLFRPNDLMDRDFFVSLATAIGCKECLTPTTEDIIKYNNSPFVDLPKINEFYYCIAYAEDVGITQGYNIDPYTNFAKCEDNATYQTSPFCAQNKISRIEAAAMLLRRAHLWDDTKNTNTQKTVDFSDVSTYWQGYAQKALEIDLIQKRGDNSIGQDDKITRGEFAIMAAKILQYTQCRFGDSGDNSIASYIEILDSQDKKTQGTIFEEGEKFSLVPKTENGEWKYHWTTKSFDGKDSLKKENTEKFNGSELSSGKWEVTLTITDTTGKIVSEPSITITILPKSNDSDDRDEDGVINKDDACITLAGPISNSGCPTNPTENDTDGDGIINSQDSCLFVPGISKNQGCPNEFSGIGVSVFGKPIVTHKNGIIEFDSIVSYHKNPILYNWDFDDGNRKFQPGIQKHSYVNAGTYKVTLTITEKNTGNTAQSRMIVRITDDSDTDGDGILDKNDKCILVKGPAPEGCPDVPTRDYGCTIRGTYADQINCTHNTGDTDEDGTLDSDDKCITIPGPKDNAGCPKNDNTDTDGDGTPDSSDSCVEVKGPAEWQGCPYPQLYKNIPPNACLLNKLNQTGLITAMPQCNACPCYNSIEITSPIRDCDVIFPTILSPDKQTIYSRGNFFLVQ